MRAMAERTLGRDIFICARVKQPSAFPILAVNEKAGALNAAGNIKKSQSPIGTLTGKMP